MRVRHHRIGRTPDRGDERGAVVVEMAIVAVFLVTLVAGTFDYGMAWRGSLAVTEAARAGARVGSGVGADVNADRDLLLSAQAALRSGNLLNQVQRVVIFRSTEDNGAVPPTCKTTTGSATNCNIIDGATFIALTDATELDGKGCIRSTTSKQFCPLDRKERQIEAEYVGVYIRTRYRNMFPMLGTWQTIERTAVMRIEPQD